MFILYSVYIVSGEWQILRKRKIESVGGRCQICNGTDRLEVHHRTYARLGHEEMDDLTVLCRSCHTKFHEDLPDIPKEFRVLKGERKGQVGRMCKPVDEFPYVGMIELDFPEDGCVMSALFDPGAVVQNS